uniref:Granulins domain-containing protein n=1 Tax=Palpitomonas bilix TaxID=652834 RepID=A0A7S3DD94_9EUKA
MERKIFVIFAVCLCMLSSSCMQADALPLPFLSTQGNLRESASSSAGVSTIVDDIKHVYEECSANLSERMLASLSAEYRTRPFNTSCAIDKCKTSQAWINCYSAGEVKDACFAFTFSLIASECEVESPFVMCKDGSACLDGETCCPLDSSETTYGCCPYLDGVCCVSSGRCCPSGYACSPDGAQCNG